MLLLDDESFSSSSRLLRLLLRSSSSFAALTFRASSSSPPSSSSIISFISVALSKIFFANPLFTSGSTNARAFLNSSDVMDKKSIRSCSSAVVKKDEFVFIFASFTRLLCLLCLLSLSSSIVDTVLLLLFVLKRSSSCEASSQSDCVLFPSFCVPLLTSSSSSKSSNHPGNSLKHNAVVVLFGFKFRRLVFLRIYRGRRRF